MNQPISVSSHFFSVFVDEFDTEELIFDSYLSSIKDRANPSFKTKKSLQRYLKASIANVLFGDVGFYRIIHQEDKMLQKVLELETKEERLEFLEEMGLSEPGVNKVIQAAYKLLNLQTYFTAGEKEVRAWTIHIGDSAPKAAGVIHTDFEKGFIRAEVIKYDDFVHFGSELKVKEAGKLSVEGKEYIVQDGDVIEFMHS